MNVVCFACICYVCVYMCLCILCMCFMYIIIIKLYWHFQHALHVKLECNLALTHIVPIYILYIYCIYIYIYIYIHTIKLNMANKYIIYTVHYNFMFFKMKKILF